MDQGWEAMRQALHRVRPVCRFFAAGKCRNGDNCRFSHDQESQAGRVSVTIVSDTPCKFFARGLCQKGQSCSFAHDPDARPTGEVKATNDGLEPLEDDDLKDDFIRPLSGGVVHFENGAAVSKISLASDFSSVRLSNLPSNSTPASVLALLAGVGIDQPLESIRVYKSVTDETETCVANLRAEDPDFADAVCSRLVPAARGHVKVTPYATTLSKMASGSGGRHTSTKKVHVSWFRPTKSVWLKFSDESVAKVSKAFFDSGEYKISGQHVRASRPTGSQDRRNPGRTIWTVQLVSVSAEATQDLVRDCFEPGHEPFHIEMTDASYEAEDNTACGAVRGMLTEIGPLEWWKTNVGTGGKRMRAVACFASESDARAAVNDLNNATAPFGSDIRLTLDLATSTKFKLLARIFDVIAPEIKALKTTWAAQHLVRLYDYDVDGKFKSLKIEGRQSQDVANAAAELEAILAGTIAEDANGKLWSPSLAHNGGLLQKIKDIEQQTGVVVLRDTKKCHVRVIGPETKRSEAVGLIANILQDDTSSLFTIELTTDQYEWARRGGFRAITTALGRKIAKFDIVAEPKQILIVGSKDDYDKAIEMIAAVNDENLTSSDGDTCSICWCEAEDPVLCHQYCGDCFEALAHSDASSASRVQCKGADDTCKTTITLDDLHKHLSSSAFETVLEESLKNHIDSHPLEYRPCPSPGCTQIYRVAPSGVHVCTECLVVTCKTCNEAHAGKTCGEHRDFNSEEQQELRKVKWELGAKDCPTCGAAIEKTEGTASSRKRPEVLLLLY
ncbi:hypothetical protein CONLIGDRAFT_714562 [Coniochaeta ligniaria NRRL 30616]|uniref:C3H1-type domain-containing protein n=1 Tax=Coniochaeta ligniaria NRRL 30616 TaxID=1408157 RepID=A0A1J7JJZ6_9PEZI|nr:hypothetical protein CONLIGDRAFT_714562 [Coniochaeta ligniaria NRRL 30616]